MLLKKEGKKKNQKLMHFERCVAQNAHKRNYQHVKKIQETIKRYILSIKGGKVFNIESKIKPAQYPDASMRCIKQEWRF